MRYHLVVMCHILRTTVVCTTKGGSIRHQSISHIGENDSKRGQESRHSAGDAEIALARDKSVCVCVYAAVL